MTDAEPKRERWTNKIDFLLACIGFSVGLGNVWRFPFLCYKNGGGAFLLPYFICVVIGGIPLFYLEVALGQFMSKGGVYAWKICPILQGIGWTTTAIVFFLNCYYNVILAWAFYYVFASFNSVLPWDSCDNYWNTNNCSTFSEQTNASTVGKIDATTEFWENKVLNISAGIEDIGEIKWDLALTLILAWFVVFMCIWQGIKTSGKVMYFTATSPYIFMLILLIRMALLPGAREGILFYIVPDFEKIADMQVWVDAGTQIFFSYSISLGALTALGSYNEWNHNSYRDSIIFALANSGTSIFAGFLIFSVLGFMAQQQGVSIDQVAEGGPGLAFIAYPKAVAQMPVAPLWSVLFFLMVILLGLDSQFVGVEGLTTAFFDTFPELKRGWRKQTFVGGCCVVMMLVGLCMVTRGGMYIFQLFDYYSGSRIILLVAFFMCVVIMIYGVNRFYDNIEMMYGFRISPYMKVSWVSSAPIFCLSVFVMSTINYSELTYTRPTTGLYTYPQWAIAVGWGMAGLSTIGIPATALYKICSYMRQGKPFIALFQPEQLEPHQLRPEDMHELGDHDMSKMEPTNGYEHREKGYEINEGYTPDYQAAAAPVDYDDPKLFSQPTRL